MHKIKSKGVWPEQTYLFVSGAIDTSVVSHAEKEAIYKKQFFCQEITRFVITDKMWFSHHFFPKFKNQFVV